jgi:penicillin-binding protein 1A
VGSPGSLRGRRPETSESAGLRIGWFRRLLRRTAFLAAPPLALLLVLAAGLVHHVYFDRSGLPDLESFIRFEPSTIGEIYDDRGKVLIELAREYRRVVSYDDVPRILREAILAAEDKNFFSHSGVEYRALPRVVQKAVGHSVADWWGGDVSRPLFPQGGSTLTQQLVRGYFLQNLMIRENSGVLIGGGLTERALSAVLGVRAMNKLLRKMEEVRLSLWLEEEMLRRYGSIEQAKREIFARDASFIYLGHGRYGFAAASEYYFDKPLSSYTPEDAGKAALLAGIGKSPRDYAPVPGDARPLRRRNAILALMARNGCISERLASVARAGPRGGAQPVKTDAPARLRTSSRS